MLGAMPETSAALVAYDPAEDLQVFLGHMGGPFWSRTDEGGWSFPKGLFDAVRESAQDAARREFAEEIGVPPPAGPLLDLGVHVQRSGKRIHAFAVRADRASLAFAASNTFALEWPRASGRFLEVPEIDRADWFDLEVARRKLVRGQVPILDALVSAVG